MPDKVAQNQKLYGFSYYQNVANFEAFPEDKAKIELSL